MVANVARSYHEHIVVVSFNNILKWSSVVGFVLLILAPKTP